MWYLQNVPGINLFLRNTKQCNQLSYNSFKTVSLYTYKLLPATVKVLENAWKPFQLFRRILNNVSSITAAPSLQC